MSAGPVVPPADRAEDRPRRARGAVHVHAHLDELRDHLLDLGLGRALLHHDHHDAPPHRRGLQLAVCAPRRLSPLERRASSIALEEPSGAVERPSSARAPHVAQHLRLALGLIHRKPQLLLEPADLAARTRALVQQPDQQLVQLVDSRAQVVERHGRTAPAPAGQRCGQRSHVGLDPGGQTRPCLRLGNDRHQGAARRPRRRPTADLGDVLRRGDAEAQRHRQGRWRRDARHQLARRRRRIAPARRSRRGARCRRGTRARAPPPARCARRWSSG